MSKLIHMFSLTPALKKAVLELNERVRFDKAELGIKGSCGVWASLYARRAIVELASAPSGTQGSRRRRLRMALEMAKARRHELEFLAHKACMNSIQAAYMDIKFFEREFEFWKNNLKGVQALRDLYFYYTPIRDYLNLRLSLAVAKATSDVNPGLLGDIKRGTIIMDLAHGSTKCFVDRMWQIYEPGTKCIQCGKVHHETGVSVAFQLM